MRNQEKKSLAGTGERFSLLRFKLAAYLGENVAHDWAKKK
jgi:hypothetical protein